MKTADAIDRYGSIPALAEALGVTIPAIYQWGEFPPGGRQLQLQHITKGKLKAEPNCMDYSVPNKKRGAR